MQKAKKIFWWIVVLFLLYAIFTSPNEAAGIVNAIWDVLVNGVENLAKFFDALLQKN
ncbi:MAG: hypothetical protein LWW86_02920 [Micrococcales bacterium]|nr:hypothetical protein [Micrococcales bacterium]